MQLGRVDSTIWYHCSKIWFCFNFASIASIQQKYILTFNEYSMWHLSYPLKWHTHTFTLIGIFVSRLNREQKNYQSNTIFVKFVIKCGQSFTVWRVLLYDVKKLWKSLSKIDRWCSIPGDSTRAFVWSRYAIFCGNFFSKMAIIFELTSTSCCEKRYGLSQLDVSKSFYGQLTIDDLSIS